MKNPKVFVSYSWSNPTHERWVLDLSESLISSGVEVILDKWDLKPGHDALAFMESMVTDPSIDKVLIVCDEIYSKKADGRNGGVGTETQIISKGVYDKTKQDKFIAVIAEKNEEGKAYTPTYYHSRLYIDLSSPDTYASGFEELIRTIYDQPQHKKPQLGKKPEFLNNEASINLGTSPLAKRAVTLTREQKHNAGAALGEYFSLFAENLERIRITRQESLIFDDQVLACINEFKTTRNELLQVISTAVRYMPSQECAEHLHQFLESLIKYTDIPESTSRWNENDFDNFKFIVHEIFLYTISICIKNNKIDIATILISGNYYVNSRRTESYLAGFDIFYQDAGSLEHRNQRLKLSRLSLSADIIKENNQSSGIDFSNLMQSDFLLYLRAQLKGVRWWPKTLVYLGHYPGAFEIFTRSESAQYFEKVKALLDIKGKAEIEEFVARDATRGYGYHGLGRFGLDWKRLTNMDQLACLP